MSVIYRQAENVNDLEQILTLQKINLESAVTSEESRDQGFVTIEHTLELLNEMNSPHGHIIAINEDHGVVGYCLVMLKKMDQRIPVLASLITRISLISFQGHPLHETNYCIMGQVCVDKPFRGKGVFKGLYEKMKQVLSGHFDFIITSIAKRNIRSVQAHLNVGFQVIDEYIDDQDDWYVVLWSIN